MKRRSLLARVLLVNVAISVIGSAILAGIFVIAARSAFQEQLKVRAREGAEFVAGQCGYPLLVADRLALRSIAEGALGGEDVLYLRIDDAAGEPPLEARRNPSVRIPPKSEGDRLERALSAGEDAVLEVSRPVPAPKSEGILGWEDDGLTARSLGTVRIGFSMAKQEALFRRIVTLAAIVTLLLLSAILPIQVLDVRNSLRPLRQLADFARRIGAGDLSERATAVRSDEVGEVAAALNQMVDQLKKTTVSRNHVDNILQCMGESLMVVDNDGKIETANRAALELLGYSRDEILGRTAGLVASHDGSETAGAVASYRTKSGREIPVLFNCSELRTAPGPRQGTVWAAQDMTENMRVQEELLAAKEAAERASEAKSAFLAAMSHELRTPLNAILGFSQLIEAEISESPTPVPWASYVEHIEKAGDHLLALINQVLDLSRIDACAMPLDLEVFEIAGAAADVVDSARPLAAGNGNVIGVECEPARIRGDRLRVRQCLFNLVGNACKFTEQGTVSVRGRLEESRGAAWYVIAVTDTGIGIQPADLGKLFVDFSQVDDSSTRKHGGTGLGLAISRRLCRLMGGDITVESAPGRGSTFTMRIPADAVRREPADAERGEAAEVEMAG